MKFLAVAALASVAIAAPISKDENLEPTRTVSHQRPSGTGHYHPNGTGHHGKPHGTGIPHHGKPHGTGIPHHGKPHGTGVAHGTGRPHHHKPHGTGISHSGHARPTVFHGPYERPSSGLAMPTERPILPRDGFEGDLINDTTKTSRAGEQAHKKHKSGAAKPTGHHHHHEGGEHGHAHPTGHHHKSGEHGRAKPTGHPTGDKPSHTRPTGSPSSIATSVVSAIAVSSDTSVEKRADGRSEIVPTFVKGYPSGAVRPTGHHTHKLHGTGIPHHHGNPHGTGKHDHTGPRPTGAFHWGPGIEITPEMASSLFAEHGHSMPTGFFSSLFAAHSQHGVPAQATSTLVTADYN